MSPQVRLLVSLLAPAQRGGAIRGIKDITEDLEKTTRNRSREGEGGGCLVAEQVWLHPQPTQPSEQAAQLRLRSDTLEDAHVGPADLL